MAIKKISKKKMTSKEIKRRGQILNDIEEKESKGEIAYSLSLPPDASLVEIMKWKVCKEIIKFKHGMGFSSNEIAELMGVDKSRTSEIMHYKVDTFTLDRLLGCLESLQGQFEETDKSLGQMKDAFRDKKIA